ncbi:MAG: glycosyltransferase family 4 protein [Gaiellaceae bacterium]
MRVAILVSDLHGGGAVSGIARLEAEALVGGGHDVHCVTGSRGEFAHAPVTVVRRRFGRGRFRHVVGETTFMAAASRAAAALPRLDLLIAHGGGSLIAAAWAARRHRAPTVYVIHQLIWDLLIEGANRYSLAETLYYRGIDRMALRAAAYTVSVSRYVRELAVRHGADPAQALVRSNPVDTCLFVPGTDDRTIDVLFVGRLSPEKGVETLLEAIRLLPAAHVVIVGEGRHRLRYEQAAEGRAEFVGHIDHDELPSFYRQAKVCVVPSLVDSCPVVVLEALASGTPVVASRAGGIPELIRDGIDGWTVPPSDPRALADALATALASDLERHQRAARASAEQHSNEAFCSLVRAQYEGLVSQRVSGSAQARALRR